MEPMRRINKIQTQENKMGTMAINPLLLSISVPMMISMLVQALYNIVDSIFVSRISEDALTAVSLAFPMQSLLIALGVGTGVGVNALLSKKLGEKQFEEADKIANISVVVAFCEYLVILFIGIFLTRFYFSVQTDDRAIIEYGTTYMSICLIMSFGMLGQFCFEKLLQSTGRTVYTMITQTTGAVINIIFDPILIFGLFGAPKLGIAGAAIATVAGQLVATVMAVIFNIKCNHDIHLHIRQMKPERHVIGKIFRVGIPSILMQSIGSVTVFWVNTILLAFTSTAAAVFGIYFKLQSFIFMPVFGLNNGVIPIVAYNYGAGNKERILKTMRYGMLYSMSIMLIGFVIVETLTAPLLGFFNATEYMLEIGVPALRIISICFVPAGFSIVASGAFQALNKSIYSLLLATARQLIILIPAAYLLAMTGRLTMVWFAFPVAEIGSAMVTVLLLRKTMKHLDTELG